MSTVTAQFVVGLSSVWLIGVGAKLALWIEQCIYRSARGYLPWIQYVAHQKIPSSPYDGIVAGGQGTTMCTPTGKSVPLPKEVDPH